MKLKNSKKLILREESHKLSSLKPLKLPIFSLIFLVAFNSIFAQDVYFGAHILKYFPQKSEVVLKDSAWIKDAHNTLFADSIAYFQDLNLIKAYGKAVLITGKDTFYGDSLYYNTKSKTGFAFNGYTIKEKGKIWGSAAYKDSADNVYIMDGYYTTCDNNPPHYFFQAKYMKVIRKEMAIAKPVILRVHSVPLFIVPFWMFPVKKGRKSGFLTPHIGYNSHNGKYFKNLAYYFVINNYMDVTASLDVVENIGVRGNIDFVYKIYKRLGGEIEYSHAENFWPRKREWSVKGWHRQNLPWKITLQAKMDYVSSYDYFNQYSEATVEWLKRELYSYVTVQRSLSPIPFTLTIDDRLKPDQRTRISLLPSFQYSFPTFSFLNLRLSGGILRKRLQDSSSIKVYEGMRNNISLGYNHTLLHYIRLSTNLNSAINILPSDTSNSKFTLQKSVSMQAGLSTTLYGFSIFGFPLLKIKKFVHTMSPAVNISFVPTINNDTVTFQYGTLYLPGKNLNLSIHNTFVAKTDSGKIPIMTLNLSTGYNFERKKWNNIPVTFSLSERLPVKIRGNAIYNTETRSIENPSIIATSFIKLPLPQTSFESAISDTNSNAVHKFANNLNLNFNYTITKTELFTTQTTSVSGGFRLTPTLTGNFSLSYDLGHGKFLSRSMSIKKDLHCWELTFSYNKYGSMWDYNFRLLIKKIPDIKVDKGFLKDLLP